MIVALLANMSGKAQKGQYMLAVGLGCYSSSGIKHVPSTQKVKGLYRSSYIALLANMSGKAQKGQYMLAVGLGCYSSSGIKHVPSTQKVKGL